MESGERETVSIASLLSLPKERGGRFPDEWKEVTRRIAVVHGAEISYDTEPAGAPRLAGRQ